MKVRLAYGRTGLEIEVPEHSVVIEPRNVDGLADEKAGFVDAVRRPIGTRPLREMVKPTDKVSIVISDMTRPTPNHKLVPWLLEELDFVPRRNFVVVNGTGSHRDNTREELVQMLGEDVVDTVRVINNNAFDKSTQAFLGKSPTGAEIYLNRDYIESDFKIVTGFIEPHFFAGFSGGPKGVMPGIAGIDTILPFHNARMIGHPNSTWGLLDGNPVQQEAADIALRSNPDFLLNVTLNGSKEITGYFAGDLIQAHRAGCEFVRKHSMAACAQPFDIVITTNSGYPLDQNLYQAVKGMSAAQKIVKRGGSIISAAECSDGLPNHGNYAKILNMRKSPKEILEMIEDEAFSMFDQWQVQKQALVQMWADVYVYSSLSRGEVEQAMFHYTDNIEKTLNELLRKYGPDASVGVLPLGPLTIPYLTDVKEGAE
ncbi:nickel-dependent lactate racemase [Ferviditalea candida]|uniref:Nickel-dependent lactate racemase n=1 Tax=Ferviditalea candida TaxID=3108399 RepID=A0ABU5ZG85_9BACL|nr:nickel-dependent lactate racemase [Paenibacillaceae bacterium T2]